MGFSLKSLIKYDYEEISLHLMLNNSEVQYCLNEHLKTQNVCVFTFYSSIRLHISKDKCR